ncbi:MAG TPA: hypothetical protein VKT28_14205 [Puia sp.]|nr:hypothetical protein [Puia sp.]
MKVLSKSIATALIAGMSFMASPAFASVKLPVNRAIMNKSIFSSGKESFSISVQQLKNSDVIRLLIYKPEPKRLTVRLRDVNGITIHSFLTEKSLSLVGKDYDFLGAEDGTYTLEVSDGKSKVSKQIRLEHIVTKEITQVSIQ